MTIRAIIGAIAVLAGYAVLEQSVDASTGQAGSCKSVQAYALLHRGETLAVRSQPAPDAPVVGMLNARASGPELQASVVVLNSSQSGWARIYLAQSKDFIAADGSAPRQFGWVPADLLTVDARVDGPITVYDRPGLLGGKIGSIEGEDMKFRVLGCRGTWLQVVNSSYGNVWIDKWCGREESCRL